MGCRNRVFSSTLSSLMLIAGVGIAEIKDRVLVLNHDRASVREVHQLTFSPGEQNVVFSHLPNTLIPESLHLQSKRGVLKLLGWQPVVKGDNTLQGQSLKWPTDSEEQPESKREWILSCQSLIGGDITFHVTYLCTGITWSAQYDLGLRFTSNLQERVSCDVRAQINIANSTDASFPNAYIRLLQAPESLDAFEEEESAPGFLALDPDSPLAERWSKKSEDYGIRASFKLPRRVTLSSRQTQFVALVDSSRSRATRLYKFRPGSLGRGEPGRLFNRVMQIHNTTENGLGWDLPSGEVHVFSAGSRKPVAEDGQLRQTQVGEYIEIDLGPSDDVLAQVLPVERGSRQAGQYESRHQIRIQNQLPFTVPIQWIHDPDSSLQWKVLNANAEDWVHDGILELSTRVQAESSKTIDFTLEFIQPAL